MTRTVAEVVHVVSSLEIGGAERLVVDLAAAQARTGMTASIVDLGRGASPLATAARRLGIDVVGVGRLPSRWRRLAALAGIVAARPRLAVHVHNPWALRAIAPVLPTVLGGVVYTRHGASPYAAAGWRALHRFARGFIDRVTFVTEEARAAYEAVHGVGPNHVVVANGVAVPPAAPERSAGARLRLGCVGRMVELKGQSVVLAGIAALAPALRARVEVHLFGDGPERARLAGVARRRLADVPVVFHGAVVEREQIYAGIDVLVAGSRTEGQSLAIMEAMARGIPVVATAVGGNPGLVRPGETGILVPVGSSEAIRDAIAGLIDAPDRVAELGRGARALIAENHCLDTVAARYRALYAAAG